MESRRSRIRRVFQGESVEPTPVSMRLDLWHTYATNTGTLPDEAAGCSVSEVEDMLGFCRAARYRAKVHLEFPEGWVRLDESGDETLTRYLLPRKELRKVFHHTEKEKLAGMGGRIAKYPVASEEDCKAMIEALGQTRVAADLGGFDAYDREVGDAGLPMLILGSSPADYVILELMGYEAFYYALADYPDTVNALIESLAEKFRAEIWTPALATGAELVLHGNHFSDVMTPPRVFSKYYLPYFAEFTALAHAAGKYLLWHADDGVGSLKELVLEAGFDGADCLATAPLVAQTLEDYWQAWRGRIVCWGGLPGIVFDPTYPEDDYRKHLAELRAFVRGKKGFIIGASDNVMPGAVWGRILAVRDAFAQ